MIVLISTFAFLQLQYLRVRVMMIVTTDGIIVVTTGDMMMGKMDHLVKVPMTIVEMRQEGMMYITTVS